MRLNGGCLDCFFFCFFANNTQHSRFPSDWSFHTIELRLGVFFFHSGLSFSCVHILGPFDVSLYGMDTQYNTTKIPLHLMRAINTLIAHSPHAHLLTHSFSQSVYFNYTLNACTIELFFVSAARSL